MKKKHLTATAVLFAWLCVIVVVNMYGTPFWGMFLNWLLTFLLLMFESHENNKLRKDLAKASGVITALYRCGFSRNPESFVDEGSQLYHGDEFDNGEDGKDRGICEN